MATCPNKSHPDWKALVEKEGELGANLAYVKNGYDIPRQDGYKKAPKKTTIRPRTGIFGNVFKFSNTYDSLTNHPEVASKMIAELKKLFPQIKVYKDRIIDENGNYIDIPMGKQGMHYRNAFLSAVAWSNDSRMETPPHEYAHEYIDMYRKNPLVKAAIAKYGEERLVTLIGRKYAGQKMSSSFETFINKFWDMVKKTFGAATMVDILTDSFAKNEVLGNQFNRGTEAVKNYQDADSPLLEKKTVFNANEDTESATEKIQFATKEQTAGKVFDEIFKEEDFDKSPDEMVSKFDVWWSGLQSRVAWSTAMDSGNAESANYAAMDVSLKTAVNSILTGEVENKKALLSKIRGEDIKLNEEQELALDTIYKIYQGVDYRTKVSNVSYINPDVSNPTAIEESVVDEMGIKEVVENMAKKAKRLASKNPYIQWIEKGITSKLKYVTNPRLWAKYVSGSENSIISRLLYKSLNDGREKHAEFTNAFKNFFQSKPDSYYDGSTFHNSKMNIDELATETFELDQVFNKNIAAKSIQLTKAEMLMIYLTSRQKNGLSNVQTGIQLIPIEGRNLNREDKYKLTDKQIQGIIEDINKDPQAQELITEIDKAMKYNHKMLSPVFKSLEGFDLERIENYFPMFHGAKNTNVANKKNVIEDMRNFRLRSSKLMAVRLEDPFQVLSGLEMSNSSYFAYAIPVHNAQKMIQALEDKSLDNYDTGDYISFLKGNIAQLQDNSLLFTHQGEKDVSLMFRKLQGNFAVALLAYNPGVILKQQVSLITAQSAIDGKFIRQATSSLGPIAFINPIKLLKQLSFKGNRTMLPVEWKQITDNKTYNILMKYPMFQDRFSGMITRETGEAVMGRKVQEDLITIPFKKDKDGKPLKISKSRMMMGITMMDSLTVMTLYDAVALETESRMGEAKFQSLTEEEIELHNINRLQEIIDKTQPTFDQTNRTGLAKMSNPLVRVFTMFSSATQKIGEQMIDVAIDYNQNPTQENLKKLGLRTFQTAILTSAMLTTIDILWAMAKGSWDDDDWEAIPEQYAYGTATSTFGSIHGIGTALKGIISELDSRPWSQTVQDPILSVFQEGYGSISNVFKGNFLKALKGSSNAVFKTIGIPVTPINVTKNYLEKLTEEK